ncbi:MAG: cell wall hydrolase [Holosporaceae bacterium]|jgi:spore germination cell wall hydrolase CwlJ-like protein|nr:cell wall hydrolase [Holosporaceae bacterium]
MNFSKNDIDILARTIYGEARGEFYKFGTSPLIAIANVIVNRMRKGFAKTIQEVCLAPLQFSCWNLNDPNRKKIENIKASECPIFRKCLETAENVLMEKWPDLVDGCDHYHEKTIKPFWAAYSEPKRILGSHYFYELRRKQ